MKTTLELPDTLVTEIKLRAVRNGLKLKDTVAKLLRRGLDATASESDVVLADETMLARRRAVARRFVSGEWGAELAGYEASREHDRAVAEAQDRAWKE